jgi:filamentous hemagglutinin family protein
LFRFTTISLLAILTHPLFGGVVLDGSFGTHGALPGPNFMIPANFGKQVGGNLFQSFSQFNLNSSQSASFMGPSNVHNILARVTSGSPSSIDGAIRSDIQGANLFFMNPAGVLFGQHAQLDVKGSFAVTTANYLKLVGGGRFNANLGGGDVLTSAAVSDFGFLNNAPAPVSFGGSTLNVAPQKVFSTVAGDITMSGGTISGPGSRVNLVSVKSPGEVKLDATNINSAVGVSQFTAMGDIDLTNSVKIDMSGPLGGPVLIRGGNLNLDNSQLASDTLASVQSRTGGMIDIDMTGTIAISPGGLIRTRTYGKGNAGDVTVAADSLLIDAGDVEGGAGIFARAENLSTGHGGNIAVQVHNVKMTNAGRIATTTAGQGNAGDIHVTADSLQIGGGLRSAIAANGEIGKGGNVSVTADDVKLTGNARIAAITQGSGDAGNVIVTADSLFIDGMDLGVGSTGIVADVEAGCGNGGNVIVQAHDVKLVAGGLISARTLAEGDGGDVDVTADSVLIDGGESAVSAVAEVGSSGNAGNVSVHAHTLKIVEGGAISSSTSGNGNGGDVTVTADSLAIDGLTRPELNTGISVASNKGAMGNAGNLTISVDKGLNISRGGIISAGTSSSGKGGDVTLHVGSLSIDGSITPDFHTGIFLGSDSDATGDAGNLTLRVDKLLSMVGPLSQISVRTLSSGKGGDVTIHAGSLSIDGLGAPDFEAGIFADSYAIGDAGDLTITVDKLLSIVRGGLISAATYSNGKGGDVTIHASSLSIDGSGTMPDHGTGITADTQGNGDAGNATITVDRLLSIVSAGTISARTFSNGNGGNLNIHARSLSIDGSVRPGDTGIFVLSDATLSKDATGDAGNLTVTVDSELSIVRGGSISANTYTSGNGGDLTIHARSLSIDGSAAPDFFTGVEADSSEGATGNAGNVSIRIDKALSMVGSAGITAATFSSGDGGNLNIHAGSLSIDGSATPGLFTGIFVASTGSGDAGKVFVRTAGPVKLKHGASISTSSDTTDAGSIDIISGGKIKLKDHSSITVSAGHNGGDIDITTPNLVYLLNSSITATAGANGVSGRGGNITIDPRFIVLQNSFISANAAIGQGGNIKLVSDFLFNSDLSNNNITATGTTNGTVNITAPQLDLGSELITLPTSLLSAESQLQERCTALLRGDFSSFISIGRGGTEPAPEELQSTF